jgi:predicted nucleic acid-binding protein
MPGLFDMNLLKDAAYAHVLVTSDQDLLTVARRAKTSVKLMTFDEFAAGILEQAHPLGIL